MKPKATFIPVLAISSGVIDIEFYKKAFNAIELWRLNNDDGSVHVAAFTIEGAEFRLHEETLNSNVFSPEQCKASTVTIGLVVDDPHAVVAQAVVAGATVISPLKDYEYGYRQGELADPFGHHWLIEKVLDKEALNHFIKNAK